jgi:hypothetical protein
VKRRKKFRPAKIRARIMLDPVLVAAAISLTTPEQDAEIERLIDATGDEYPFALSEWILKHFTVEQLANARRGGLQMLRTAVHKYN